MVRVTVKSKLRQLNMNTDGEIFRERVAPAESTSLDKTEINSETNKESYAIVKETAVDHEFRTNLEAWETEGKKKYVNEYFDTHNIASDFSAKMLLGTIDKFVRAEMEEGKYDKTIDNYKKILQDIESEIGSDRLELFERFRKLTGYIKALGRLREIKKKLGAYKPDESD